jgi:hypothetical protein
MCACHFKLLQNLRYRPRGEGGQGGPGGRAPVGASAGEVRGGAIDWGCLATRPDAFGSSGYDLLKDDPEERGPPGERVLLVVIWS